MVSILLQGVETNLKGGNSVIISLSFLLLLLQLQFGKTTSWILPPQKHTVGLQQHQQEQWESVHEMRRRLNIQYNYTPQVISEELCRYVSEEDCKDADLSMRLHIASQKALQKRKRKNPNIGKFKVLVLMIRFSDHVDREMIPKQEIDTFWQTKVPDWLNLNSQGLYSIEPVVIDWRTTDNTEIYYAMGKRGITPELQKMAWPILDELDNRPDWDWSQFDMDGNGRLDSVVMIHSGYGAETFTTDCFDREFTDRIWAHAFSSSRNSWKSKDKSVRLNGYTVASAFHGDCGAEAGKIGLTTHEYMHTLGLEDLYDGKDALAASGVGAFDIMAYPYGQDGNADIPGHLSLWSKVLAEWATPTVIEKNGVYTLKASEISNEAFRINLSEPDDQFAEYLLIENRQPLEFDINIWSAGLVIYHVDDAAPLQKNLGYPGQPGWPQNGNHYQVALLPKDGKYDLEKGTNTGDAGDMWEPGDVLGPGQGNTVFPNTDRYQDGNIRETGVRLEVLSQQGTDVTFCVTGIAGSDSCVAEAATPNPTVAPTVAPAVATSSSNGAPQGVGQPTVPTVPAQPSDSYLENFMQYEQQPSSSYLSTFEGATPPPTTGSYLSTFDSLTNLRGSDDPALQKDESESESDVKGFIALSYEALITLGGATPDSTDTGNAASTNPPAAILHERFSSAKRKRLDIDRNPAEDIRSVVATEETEEHSGDSEEVIVAVVGPNEFGVIGPQEYRSIFSSSASLWDSAWALVLSASLSLILCIR